MDLEYEKVERICLLCKIIFFDKCICFFGKKLKIKREDEGVVFWYEVKKCLGEYGIKNFVVII